MRGNRMSFASLGEGSLDYAPCRYRGSRSLFRGPERKLDEPFGVVIGGSEAYGKFIANPFPSLIEAGLDMPVVNLGAVNASVDLFLGDAVLIGLANDAAFTVVQITGAQNISNRFYSVHPRRNDRFIRPTALLQSIFPRLDFSEINFTRHLLRTIADQSPQRFRIIVDDLRDVWVKRMNVLLDQIRTPVVLLWMAEAPPADDDSLFSEFGEEPLFVTQKMISALGVEMVRYAEIVAEPSGLVPGLSGLVCTDLEAASPQLVLPPVAHLRAAQALMPILMGIVGKD
jgi:hypothetical protein